MIVSVVMVAGLLTGCHNGSADSGAAGGGAPASVGDQDPIPALGGATLAQLSYGAAPSTNDGVNYQPDVVKVDGGSDAIRSLSSDGLTWTIKGDAGHAHDLAVGKIMFVTNRAVGRILSIEPVGADLAVVVGPVQLGEVIADANLHGDQDIDLASMVNYSAPDQPGSQLPDPATDPTDTDPASTDPSSTDPATEPATDPTTTVSSSPDPASTDPSSADPSSTDPSSTDQPAGVVQLPGIHLISSQGSAGGQTGDTVPFPSLGSTAAQTVDGVPISRMPPSAGIGVNYNYNQDGISLEGRIALHLQAPKFHFSITVVHGTITAAEASLDGAASMTMIINGKTDVPEGGAINLKPRRVNVPFDISLPVGGTPLAITIRHVFVINTVFGAREATLSADAEMGLGGAIGVQYHDGQLHALTPTGFAGMSDLLNSVTGASLGVNGLILTSQISMIIGIGAFGFVAGPQFSIKTTMVATKQALEAAVPCQQAQFKIEMGVGLGYSIPLVVAKVINFFLHALRIAPINPSGGPVSWNTLVDQKYPTSGPCQMH